ncbi:ABC transporter ATP-binding protein/permease [Lachnospiraceae bacterium NSJ-143]|nr:ABC transporter ATP-binding protein/permease [Lachnospiraceae bacterium NSJ-143]
MDTLKRFLGYYKPHWKLFAFDIFCAFVVSMVDISIPQILRFLTNDLFLKGKYVILESLPYIFAALMIMYFVRMLCQYFIGSWGHVMGSRMESDMRRDLFGKMEELSFSYYDKHSTGDMTARMVSDLFDISELAHHGPENIFLSFVKITGSVIFLMAINVRLTLLLFAIIIFIIVFSGNLNVKMRKAFMDNRRKISGINVRLQDSIEGIRVVKSFANEEAEAEKFKEANMAFLKSKKDSYMVMGSFQAGNGFLQGLLYVAVLVAGGYYVAKGSLNAADLAVYALYINVVVAPINILVEFLETFQKGFAGFKRFIEIMDTKAEIEDKPDAEELTDVKGKIDYENVSFSYDSAGDILSGLNISIEPGKTAALVGASGGGKTTICSLLPRFYDVTGGSIKIDGKDIRNLKQESLRKAIGIVQQDVYLFGSTFRDNIAYGKIGATDNEIVEAAKKANIHDYIMSLPEGYDTNVGERGVRLSGGQRQRISIARVFLKNPKILILDEATSALDNESERYIQNSLDELAKGRTTVVIAHRLSTIVNADIIYVIENGSVKEKGNHSELLEKGGTYAKYYNMQFRQ